jgi:SAM-dependent methyltransferase
MSDLATIQAGWDHAARVDPFFNIITIHGLTPDEFWARGEREIDAMLERLQPVSRGRALDFGCGIGRLTQALARHYERVDGIDISGEMVTLARGFNRRGKRCAFHVNQRDDLAVFEDGMFDLVYSMIVLQHMPAPLAERYVQEFIRVLAPNGAAVFEIPTGPGSPHANAWLSMYGAACADVEQWVVGAEAKIVDVEPINDGSYRYTAVRA